MAHIVLKRAKAFVKELRSKSYRSWKVVGDEKILSYKKNTFLHFYSWVRPKENQRTRLNTLETAKINWSSFEKDLGFNVNHSKPIKNLILIQPNDCRTRALNSDINFVFR